MLEICYVTLKLCHYYGLLSIYKTMIYFKLIDKIFNYFSSVFFTKPLKKWTNPAGKKKENIFQP